MEKTEWPRIWIGTIVWKEAWDKVKRSKYIEKLLNNNLDLDDYGGGLRSIRFVPISVLPSNPIHEESIKYAPQKKELAIYLKLDFDAVKDGDEDSYLTLVAHLFLRAIDEAPQHKVKDFDWPRFRKDVAGLFEAEGWLQAA